LIALLALRKLRLYENGDDGLKLENKALDAGTFVDTVSDFAPDTYLFVKQSQRDSWRNFSRISIDGETIGALSINTIVCPAFSISLNAKEKLHKIAPTIVNDKGEFQPPVKYYADVKQAVNNDAKYALLAFLDILRDEITQESKNNPLTDLIATLQKLVKRFRDDLLKSGAPVENTAIQIPTPDSADAISTVQDLFNKLVAKNVSGQKKPFLLERARKRMEDDQLDVALIGLDICGISSSDSRAATIFVTDNLLYNQITPDNARAKSKTIVDNIYLLYDKDLLLDTMVVINRKDNPAFPEIVNGTTQISGYEIIWPVSKELLELYNSEALSQMLSIRKKEDKLIVSLALKLADGNTHIVEKEYKESSSDSGERRKNGTYYALDQKQLPFSGVWPHAEVLDINGRNTWKIYTYFYDELKAGKIRIKASPVFWNKVQGSAPSKLLISDPQRDVYYQRFTELPYAITFVLVEDGSESEAGAILLGSPKQHPANSMSWNIGLDFGTTSTTAFFAKPGDSPKFLRLLSEYGWKEGKKSPDQDSHEQLENGVKALVNSGSAGGEDNFTYFFIDDKCLDQNSYITTYEVMNNTTSSSGDVIFENGRVFWHNFDNFALFNSREGRRDNLKTNIKWDSNKSFIGKYLKQMITQMVYAAAVKGIRKINWYFSYPTAFSNNNKDSFESTLKKLIKDVSSDTGVEIFFDGSTNMITESVAAAYYFRQKKDRHDTFLCIDIGGGTSDISIWNEGSNLFQSSIRFASRDMFITPLSTLLQQKGVMDIVQGTEQEDGIHAMLTECSKDVSNNSSENERIKFFIETVLFEYFETVRDRLEKLEGDGASYYNKFKYSIFIAYTGLMYYVGNIICAMLTTAEAEKKIDSSRAEIVYGLSGKGSKLTVWIKSHCDIIHEAVEKLILNKTGVKINLIFSFEEQYAKTETAQGLICNLDPAGGPKDKAKLAKPEVFLGNSITLIKDNVPKIYEKDVFVRSYGDDDYIQDTKNITFELDRDLRDFDEFLEFFNKLAPETEGDMPKIDLNWYKEKRNVLYGRLEKDFKSIFKDDRFEAPFITILKGFIKDYSEEYLYAKK
ncbi:MAG: hypothetical protein LBU51_03500, partial [Bacteroidales bacterium]|nr:hypothetical protein [Bacteroidales bacterium]